MSQDTSGQARLKKVPDKQAKDLNDVVMSHSLGMLLRGYSLDSPILGRALICRPCCYSMADVEIRDLPIYAGLESPDQY